MWQAGMHAAPVTLRDMLVEARTGLENDQSLTLRKPQCGKQGRMPLQSRFASGEMDTLPTFDSFL